MKNLKRMKLYHNPQRIYNEIDALGNNKDSKLKAKDLCLFDQYHYLGTDAVDDAIISLKIDSEDEILDIGSGIGGPARYLADKTGCQVTAVELQPELHKIGLGLTERCGLSNLVKHVCGDILEFKENNVNFDFVVSWLSFLHIPDRSSLFKKCFHVLKPDGRMFIEDFYKLREFTKEEIKVLSNDISCDYLPSSLEYEEQLIKSGFVMVELTNRTDSWKNFVKERKEKFIQNRDSQIEIHNEIIIGELEDFYTKMDWLFDGGNLGGIKIISKK